MVRVVIDSNVIISALITRDPASPAVRLLRAAFNRKQIVAYTSPHQLAELIDVLNRRKFRKRLLLDDAMAFIGLIKTKFNVVPGTYQDLDIVPTDAKDNLIVAIAFEANLKYIVSIPEYFLNF